jgi:hypothetical protein
MYRALRLQLVFLLSWSLNKLVGHAAELQDSIFPKNNIALIRAGGKGSVQSIAANLTDIPNRRWRDRLCLALGTQIKNRWESHSLHRLQFESDRLFSNPRIQTEWCLSRKSVPFLGGAKALAYESILENDRLHRELDEVHLFLPGSLGWSIPRSDDNLSSSLYHLASSGALKILSLNGFSPDDADPLLAAGRLLPSTIERLIQRACPELCPAVLRVRHLRDAWGEAVLRRGAVLECAGGGAMVLQETVAFELPPRGLRELLLPCLRLRPPPPGPPPPPPRGELRLTPFALDLSESPLDPLESHRSDPSHPIRVTPSESLFAEAPTRIATI